MHLTRTKRRGQDAPAGPFNFQKYETAELVPSKAISNLLRVLEAHPSALEVLRREAQVTDKSQAPSV